HVFEKIGKSGCQIKIMSLDPDCEAAKHVYGGKYDFYRTNIESSIKTMIHLKQVLGNKFLVKKVGYAPTVSIIIIKKKKNFQNQVFMRVQLYFLRGAIGADRPIFRVDYKDKWYKVFKKEFDLLWEQSASDWDLFTKSYTQ
ncbi:MAG TPA: hypothetical protein VJ202_05360, partial [Thermodesulfobacteriota bacterium]|nr:hypothetical protein [Thermodesulfobacteriota bacterium]